MIMGKDRGGRPQVTRPQHVSLHSLPYYRSNSRPHLGPFYIVVFVNFEGHQSLFQNSKVQHFLMSEMML